MIQLLNSIENLPSKALTAAIGIALMPIVAAVDKYLMIDWPFIFVFVAFMALDLVTGIKAARVRGEAVTSYGLRRTAIKVRDYGIALFVVHGLRVWAASRHPATGSVADAIHVILAWVDYLFYAFCLCTEAISIVENTSKFSKNRIIGLLAGLLGSVKTKIEEKIADIADDQTPANKK